MSAGNERSRHVWALIGCLSGAWAGHVSRKSSRALPKSRATRFPKLSAMDRMPCQNHLEWGVVARFKNIVLHKLRTTVRQLWIFGAGSSEYGLGRPRDQ